jgi:hypothetical protein
MLSDSQSIASNCLQLTAGRHELRVVEPHAFAGESIDIARIGWNHFATGFFTRYSPFSPSHAY